VRHLDEPLGGVECLLETVSVKEAMEIVSRGGITNSGRE